MVLFCVLNILPTLAELVRVQLTARVFKFIVQVCNDVVKNVTLHSTHFRDVECMMKCCTLGRHRFLFWALRFGSLRTPGRSSLVLNVTSTTIFLQTHHIIKHLTVAAKLACYLGVVLSVNQKDLHGQRCFFTDIYGACDQGIKASLNTS